MLQFRNSSVWWGTTHHTEKNVGIFMNNITDVIEIPMMQYNRIQDPILKLLMVICVEQGTALIIEDEPET